MNELIGNPTSSEAVKPGLKTYLKSSLIVLLAFASLFFSRLIDTFGAPSPINFLHFATVPFACSVVLCQSRIKNRQQILIGQLLLIGLLIFLSATLISALLNNAGAINAVLAFLLLGEPFILSIAIIALPMALDSFITFQTWIRRFCLFHIFFALAQRYVLRFDLRPTGMEPPDNIQGVFFLSGSGHVVGTSVSLSFALYYLMTAKEVPLWFRLTVMAAAFMQMMAADGKQVVLSFIVAWVLLVLLNLKDVVKAIQYVLGGTVFGIVFFWVINNVPAFQAFTVWMRPEIYGPNGEATLLKTAAFRIVPTYYESPLNWLFGLGPGHTVGRLGGWMLREYASLLNPLGATRHEASGTVWQAVGESWLGSQSSMFSPLFGWAGIWGDFGFFGLGSYFLLAFIVWRYLCRDDCTKILVLSVFVTGCIFSQLEEPGYMLTIAAIIGLRWHEQRVEKGHPNISKIRKRSWRTWL